MDFLQNLHSWFSDNSLFFNTEKTTYLRFHNRQKNCEKILISLNNAVLQQDCSSVKFLGLILDECLTWNLHCESLLPKLNSTLYLFRNLRDIISKQQLTNIYYAYVESRLRYGIILWGTSTRIKEVFTVQKKNLGVLLVFLQGKLVEIYLENISY